jgi:tripeptidyl-peptidase I
MMSLRLLAAAALWLAPVSCTQSQIHETASAPSNWQLVGRASQAAYVRLSVALSQPGLSELKKRLSEISDLDNPDFGAHLSKARIRDYRKPDGAALESVYTWLTQGGAEDVQVDSTYIHFNANVKTANSLLDCTFSEYQSPRGVRVYRATEYSLPSELAPHIRFVYPVTQFIETPEKGRANAETEQEHSVSRRQTSSKNKETGLPCYYRFTNYAL